MAANNDGIQIEVYEINQDGRTRIGGGTKIVRKSAEQVDAAVEVAKQVAGRAAMQLEKMDHCPDEIQLKLGLKFTVEVGAIIAKTATEGNLEVTLTWKRLPVSRT